MEEPEEYSCLMGWDEYWSYREEAMTETDELLSEGRLAQYSIDTKPGINFFLYYTTRRFCKG